MKTRIHHNDTEHTVIVSGVTIGPGQAREVPDYSPDAPAEPEPPTDVIGELIDKSIPTIVAEFPNLSDAQLDELEQREKDGKTRTTLIEKIMQERQERHQRDEAAREAASAAAAAGNAGSEGSDAPGDSAPE